MKEIRLFDYQEEMVERIGRAFGKHQSVMVQMPTGTGKTIVLSNVVFSFLEKDKREVWVVAHRRELVSQIEETFSKITPSLFTIKEGSTAFPKPLFLMEKVGCTRQYESELSLRSLAPLFPIKEGSFENPPVLPYP